LEEIENEKIITTTIWSNILILKGIYI
jgi:hypothetical protein